MSARADAGHFSGGTDPAMWVVDTGTASILLDQWYGAVAAGDSLCFAVWCDNNSSGDISGGLVTSEVRRASRSQVSICRAAGQQARPAIARGDACHLVAWQDRRSGNFDIYAARVAFDGAVLDPGGFPVSVVANDQLYPRVTAGDSAWLVVWTDNRTGTDVFGARVAFDGTLLDPGGLPIGTGPGIQTLPDAAWSGSEFLVVWKSDEAGAWTTRGARVMGNGTILDPAGFDIAGDRRLRHSAGHPAVASDGQDFIVVWQNEDTPRAVYATRVSEGRPVGDHIQVSPAGWVPQTEPRVSYGHGRYLVTWQTFLTSSREDIWGCRMTREGVVIDTAGIRLAVREYGQYLANSCATAGGWLVCLNDNRAVKVSLYGVGVDTAGAVTGEPERLPALHSCWTGQTAPALAAGRGGYLAVWESRDTTGAYWRTDICARVLGPDGMPRDTASFPVAMGGGDELTPAVARGESSYAVVWAYPGGPRVTIVTESGRVLDNYGTLLADSGAEPDVTCGAGQFLVAWHRDWSQDEIRAARVREDGTVLDPGGFIVSVGTDTKRNPAVAFDGQNYLVVWHTDHYVKGARVRPGGTVVDPSGFNISTSGGRFADVAFDGENYLVVWTTYSRISGTRVTPSAEVLDPSGRILSWGPGGGNMLYPTVDFNGEHFIVAWAGDYSTVIKGTMLSRECGKIDSFAVSLADPLARPASPSVASGPGGGLLVFSGRTQPGMPWDTLARIWAALLGLPREDFRRPVTGGVAGDTVTAGAGAGFAVHPAQFRQSVRLVVARESGVHGFHIHDAAGRRVRVLDREAREWDGRDGQGAELPSGVYLVEAVGPGPVERRKAIKLE
ncbi:MAG: hypothetical protein R6X12_01495 [bacterium]